MNKLFRRKKSKIGTAAKVLIPAAGVIAAKKLWDNKESLISDNVRSKTLEKTEELQEKVQKFHDFVQNAGNDSAESQTQETDTEKTDTENAPKEETCNEASGEEANENNPETVEGTTKNDEEDIEKTSEVSEETDHH